MAREGKIASGELLQDPTPIRQVMQAIKDHKEALEERAIDHDKLSERLSALKEIHEQSTKTSIGGEARIGQILQGGMEAVLSAVKTQEGLAETKESVLDQFCDENVTQGVVYGIAVNHLRKRVTVIFRGSVTQQDFLTDSRSAQKKVDNPLCTVVEEAPKHIQLHTGFYTYLFAKDKEDEEKLRCDRILSDVKKLLKENPGYRLYFTGHSLGGEFSCCVCALRCSFLQTDNMSSPQGLWQLYVDFMLQWMTNWFKTVQLLLLVLPLHKWAMKPSANRSTLLSDWEDFSTFVLPIERM